jgi:tetratricopeptide (TPR) repeat protein
MNFKLIQFDFFKVTFLALYIRETNKLEDNVTRKDTIFNTLGDKIFMHPKLLAILKKKITYWIRLFPSETVLSLAGYIYYFDEDYSRAEEFFYRAIEENCENLDNWLDLAFSLYHQSGNKFEFAYKILFDFDKLINYYNESKIKEFDFNILKRLYSDIEKQKRSYQYIYSNYVSAEVLRKHK